MTRDATLNRVLEIKKMRIALAKRRLMAAMATEKRALEVWQLASQEEQHYSYVADTFLSTAFMQADPDTRPHLFVAELASGHQQSVQRATAFRDRAQHRATDYADYKLVAEGKRRELFHAEDSAEQFATLLSDRNQKRIAQLEQNSEDEIAELFAVRKRHGN